jgi:hypothetical protein
MLAIMAMIEAPFESIPSSLKSGWSQFMKALVSLFKSYPEALKNKEELEKLYEFDGDEDEGEEEEEFVDADLNDDPALGVLKSVTSIFSF